MNDPNYQQHDFEPGIADNGLFWTIPIGNGLADADPSTGGARFTGQSVKVDDYHDIVNAVFGGGPTPIPSRVSFDVRWAGGGGSSAVRDADYEFIGEYVTGKATISFTAFNEHGDVMYTSDPDLSNQSNPGPPGVGIERNGEFFS